MKIKLLLPIIFLLLVKISVGQTQDTLNIIPIDGSPPIPIEVFAGDKGVTFQLIVSKQFSQKSRFGFFNVTTFSGDYEEVSQVSVFYSQSVLTAKIWKGISIIGGLSTVGSSSPGIMTVRPTSGLQYLFANRDFVVVILPRFDLTQTYNFETFAVFEYTPMLSKNWGIYSRIQALYNYNTKLDFHEVSSIYVRLGVSYKNFQFGLGSNHDFYGADNYNVNNFGLFIKTNLF
ncbi:hypothetical protein [Aurantibacillus circumpalustris]|uniref:hypothetical protein n=1 Tax=Aurantibacillus circumpalustris TaxID=3036359 RepID=UPI00295BE9CB|nr:hypothetical protein [Aurantibacillus circumpalustris]